MTARVFVVLLQCSAAPPNRGTHVDGLLLEAIVELRLVKLTAASAAFIHRLLLRLVRDRLSLILQQLLVKLTEVLIWRLGHSEFGVFRLPFFYRVY